MTQLAIAAHEPSARAAAPALFHQPDCPWTGVPGGESLESNVRRACRLRGLRRTLLGDDYFTGPAWGILLHLFDSHLRQVRETVGSLGAAADVATTTLLRWLERLDEQDLVASREDPLDARRRYVELTPAGVELMTRYFDGAAMRRLAA